MKAIVITRWLRSAACVAALATCFAVSAGPVEDTGQAERAYRDNDLATAMMLFRRAADAGHAPAQARLGDILDAAEEDAAAVEYYRKAALQGDAAGEYGLGSMYDKGEGVARDAAEALKWYRAAAAKDYLPAVQAIAWAYFAANLGLAADPQEAERWGQHAVKLGGIKPSAAVVRAKQTQK